MSDEQKNIKLDAPLDEEAGTPIPSPAKPRRRWLIQILLSLVILSCGIAIGSAVTLNVVWKRFVDGFQRPEGITNRVVSRMKWTLELTPEQEEQIQQIFKEHEETIRAIRMEYQPFIQAEMESLEEKVKGVLTPEQAEEWGERFRGMEKMWMGPRPPGGPGGPGRDGGPGGRRFRGGDGERRGPPWREEPPPDETQQEDKQE